MCVWTSLCIYILINEFEIIYLDSIYFVGVGPKPEVEELLLLDD